MKLIASVSFILFLNSISAQKMPEDSISRKKFNISKTTNPPKIDGILDDDVWQNLAAAKNFIQKDPENGKPEDPKFRTEVKMTYDDTGIYFSARMYDPEPSKIAKELVERDDIGNDDFFGVTINGYNDKQQTLEFIVMPSGVQFDAKATNDYGEDSNWSAVWFSAANIDELGWTVEMKIPFSELRFPKKDIQEWGLNMIRSIRRSKTSLTWNFVDNTKGSIMLYDGVLSGISNVEPPLRLSFLPYFSSYINNFDGKTSTSVNGGMDVKYGINDAFTLDTTLIPDFGQTAFDDNILNLGPFEQQFAERRPFFTEGTELFSKGNLFYSRRVGDYPSTSPNLGENEELTENVQKVKLLNATKISGRTNKGLGIGFFNGITQKTEVDIVDRISGNVRLEVLEPIANYNVFVLDQRFNGNSSVSLINTNVTRNGSFRDANATALLVDLTDKQNKFNYYGGVKGSFVNDLDNTFGTNIYGGAGKISGKNRYSFGVDATTKNYDIDDLGYTGRTNYINYSVNYRYRILQPSKNFNQLYWNNSISHSRRLDTDLFSSLVINSNISLTDKEFRNYGGGIQFTPNGENDLYEPRVFGRHLAIPGYFNPFFYFNSDNRKKLTYNLSMDYYVYDEKARHLFINSLGMSYRLNDHLSLSYYADFNFSNQEQGYVGRNDNNIYIGTRNRNTVTNNFSSQYTLNNKMAVSLNFRHYYTEINYKQFGILQEDGNTLEVSDFNRKNQTFNSWNIDMRYSWWFAPGSQLTLLYQNASQNFLDYSKVNFRQNFKSLFNEPMNNTLSLKVTYYIDYNTVKNLIKKS